MPKLHTSDIPYSIIVPLDTPNVHELFHKVILDLIQFNFHTFYPFFSPNKFCAIFQLKKRAVVSEKIRKIIIFFTLGPFFSKFKPNIEYLMRRKDAPIPYLSFTKELNQSEHVCRSLRLFRFKNRKLR